MQRLHIEVRVDSTQHDAIASCMNTLAEEYHKPCGLTARQAVINVLECTNMIPGVFNLQMLSWRQRLHDILFNPQLTCPFSTLQYRLHLAVDHVPGVPLRTIGTQTDLSDPRSSHILEFKQKNYDLCWVLCEP